MLVVSECLESLGVPIGSRIDYDNSWGVRTLEGKPFRFSKFKGKRLLVAIYGICSNCEYISKLNFYKDLTAKHPGKLHVMVVFLDSLPSDLREALKLYVSEGITILTNGKKFATMVFKKQWGGMFLVDEEGVVKYCYNLKLSRKHRELFKIISYFAEYGEVPPGTILPTELIEGKKAPDIEFVDLDGKKYSLSSFYGKPTVFVFISPGCQHCIPAVPFLRKIYEKYGDKINVFRVGESLDCKEWGEEVKEFYEKYGTEEDLEYFKKHSYPTKEEILEREKQFNREHNIEDIKTLLTEKLGTLDLRWHVTGIPHAVLLDKNGVVVLDLCLGAGWVREPDPQYDPEQVLFPEIEKLLEGEGGAGI